MGLMGFKARPRWGFSCLLLLLLLLQVLKRHSGKRCSWQSKRAGRGVCEKQGTMLA
jgi:hypothetical protein